MTHVAPAVRFEVERGVATLTMDQPATDVNAAYETMTALSARLFSSDEATGARSAFGQKRPVAWAPVAR